MTNTLEAACRRALFLQAFSLQSVTSILKHHLDEAHLPSASVELPVTQHGNLRGAAYFADSDDHDFDPTLN